MKKKKTIISKNITSNYTAIIPKRPSIGILIKVEDLSDMIKKFIFKGLKH